jgi:drug/metabolite transporter (DMT)-like permease
MTGYEPRAGSRASRGPARARRWPGWLMIVGGFVGLVIATTVIQPGAQTKSAVLLGAILGLIFVFVIIAGVITLIRRARARSSSTEGS